MGNPARVLNEGNAIFGEASYTWVEPPLPFKRI